MTSVVQRQRDTPKVKSCMNVQSLKILLRAMEGRSVE